MIYTAFFFAVRCYAASYEFTFDEVRVFGNRNDGKTLSEEVTEILASSLPLGIERTRLEQLGLSGRVSTIINSEPETPDHNVFSLVVDSRSGDEEALREVARKLTPYLRLRLKGHTNAYARWIVWSGLNTIPAALLRRYPFLPSAIGEVGVPWIREDIAGVFALPAWHKQSPSLVVVDGDLAWLYQGQTESGRFGATCFDALELIPALKDAFSVAQARWEARSEPPGSENWSFCSEFLRANFHIHWRSPRELNPASIID